MAAGISCCLLTATLMVAPLACTPSFDRPRPSIDGAPHDRAPLEGTTRERLGDVSRPVDGAPALTLGAGQHDQCADPLRLDVALLPATVLVDTSKATPNYGTIDCCQGLPDVILKIAGLTKPGPVLFWCKSGAGQVRVEIPADNAQCPSVTAKCLRVNCGLSEKAIAPTVPSTNSFHVICRDATLPPALVEIDAL